MAPSRAPSPTPPAATPRSRWCPPDREVLTVEYKVNFLAPASGEKLVARGEVLTTGRRLFVCKAEVFAVADGESRACAASLQTVSLSPVRA